MSKKIKNFVLVNFFCQFLQNAQSQKKQIEHLWNLTLISSLSCRPILHSRSCPFPCSKEPSFFDDASSVLLHLISNVTFGHEIYQEHITITFSFFGGKELCNTHVSLVEPQPRYIAVALVLHRVQNGLKSINQLVASYADVVFSVTPPLSPYKRDRVGKRH